MDSSKEKLKETASPFRYRPGMRYIPVDYNTAGRRTINELDESGFIREREKLIMRFLYEMGELTAHQIQLAFSHPLVDGRLKKVSMTGRNPYQTDINELVRKGLVHANRFLVNDKLTTKVYSLSKTCAAWFESRVQQTERYFDQSETVRFKQPKKECLQELDHLAAVSYHIADVCREYDKLSAYAPVFTEGINVFDGIYSYGFAETVLLLSIRCPKAERTKAVTALGCSLLKKPHGRLLFITPDDVTMRELRELIKAEPDYDEERTYYTTDMEVHFSQKGAPTVFLLDDDGQTAFSGEMSEPVDDM